MSASAKSPDDRLAARLRALRPLAAGIVIVIPCVVLLGWILEIEPLKRVLPGFVAMNPMTALSFLAAGAGLLWIEHRGWARAGALIPFVVGTLVLGRYLFGWDSGIDRLLFQGTLLDNVMAPTTAFDFVLVGLALWLAAAPAGRSDHLAQYVAMAVATVALLALTGYGYGVEKLYRLASFIAMAVHTALCFLILAVGLLGVRPERGPMAHWTSTRAGGVMFRRLLVPTIIFPLALGWVLLRAQRAGLFESAFGFTLLVIAVIVFLSLVIGRSAGLLDEEDERRAEVETQLRQAHSGLEGKVQRRTGDLRQAIESVRAGLQVLGSSTAEILASSSALAVSANQTAASVAETTATVEEARRASQMASRSSARVAASAQKAEEIASAGTAATRAAAVGMEAIRGGMSSIAGSMVQLSNQTRAIGEIIAAVDELANRSNLLAVNAAIEAAAAGAEGKGFAVVADEMKYLASESRRATRQVRTILNDIQKATGAAVMTTEQAARAVEAGAAQATVAGESIQSLESSVGAAAQAATEIAASSNEQLVGMNHVAGAMDRIKSASVENVDAARRLEIAARDLNGLGQQLKELAEKHRA